MTAETVEYYADNLETPHPERPTLEPRDERLTLATVIRSVGYGEQLVSIKDESERQSYALAAAHIICSQVRDALWYVEPRDFARFEIEDSVVSLDALERKQAARCIGFTVVASECLEMAGIDHWVGFANGHSTLVLPTEGEAQLNLVDPLSVVLSQNLEHSLVTAGFGERSVNDDMQEFGRSAIELNTVSLAAHARGNTAEIMRDHPWLMFRRSDKPGPYDIDQEAKDVVLGHDRFGNFVHPSKARIFMSLHWPEDGRQLLHSYDAFRTAYARGDYLEAGGVLYDRIGDDYPNLDARQSHGQVKTIIRELSSMGNANYARKLLDTYFESFELMADDSRVPEAHGDCLSIVARTAGDMEAAREAVEIYKKVLEYKRSYKTAVEGKLAKATALVAELQPESVPQA